MIRKRRRDTQTGKIEIFVDSLPEQVKRVMILGILYVEGFGCLSLASTLYQGSDKAYLFDE
jgi:hypothetical protein